MIHIADLDKADVLAALYNAAATAEGYTSFTDPMTHAEAQRWLNGSMSFTALKGKKSLRVDLSGDEFDETYYDADNGPGAAYAVVTQLRWHGREDRRWRRSQDDDEPLYRQSPVVIPFATDPAPIPDVPTEPSFNAFGGGRSGGAGGGAGWDAKVTFSPTASPEPAPVEDESNYTSNDNPAPQDNPDWSGPVQQAEAPDTSSSWSTPAEAPDTNSAWDSPSSSSSDSSSSYSSDSGSSYDSGSSFDSGSSDSGSSSSD